MANLKHSLVVGKQQMADLVVEEALYRQDQIVTGVIRKIGEG